MRMTSSVTIRKISKMSSSTCNDILVILTTVVSLYLALLIAEDIFCIVASMIRKYMEKERKVR